MITALHPDVVQGPIPLAAGQAITFFGRQGAALHIMAGAVELREPAMRLAEQLYWPRQCLPAGMVLPLPRSGWYELRPVCDSTFELRLQAAPVFSARGLRRILAVWFARRRRRLAA